MSSLMFFKLLKPLAEFLDDCQKPSGISFMHDNPLADIVGCVTRLVDVSLVNNATVVFKYVATLEEQFHVLQFFGG